MVPHLTTRSFSNDQTVFNKVFFENYYQLRGDKDKNRVIVDIGAHAGYFAFAALSLGAKKVYSFEPYLDNFNLLLKNCYNHTFTGRVTPYQLGVYVNAMIGKFGPPNVIDGVYFDLKGIGLVTEGDYYPCQCVELDTILKTYCFDEKIDILKINIGYAEKEILLWAGDSLQNNVNSICGEVTANDAEFLEFKKAMGLRGYIHCLSKPQDTNGRVQFQMSLTFLTDNFI